VADGLVVGDGAAAGDEGARLAADGAEVAAGGARALRGQGLGLLPQQGGEGALGQAAGGGVGDLLEGVEVDVEAGAAIAEGAAGNDFAPVGRR
jgi:hypothetical protein